MRRLVVAAFVLLAARDARADAGACPDSRAFASNGVIVRFERTEHGLRATITTADGRQRTLEDDGPDCAGLAEATALAVKLASEASPPPAPLPTPPPPPPQHEEPETAPVVVCAKVARRALEISAGGVVAFGLGSPVAPGLRFGAALTLADDRLALGLTGVVLPSRSREVGGGTVDVAAIGGGVEGCGRGHPASWLLLSGCGRLEVLRLDGDANGFDRSSDRARALFIGTLLLRASARVKAPLSLYAEGGAIFPFARQRFTIDTVGVVYDPPAVGAMVGIGALVDFE